MYLEINIHGLSNQFLFVCLTGRPCGTRLSPGGPDSSKSSSQAKSLYQHAGYKIRTDKNRFKKRTSLKKALPTNQVNNFTVSL